MFGERTFLPLAASKAYDAAFDKTPLVSRRLADPHQYLLLLRTAERLAAQSMLNEIPQVASNGNSIASASKPAVETLRWAFNRCESSILWPALRQSVKLSCPVFRTKAGQFRLW
jgi:hypothetical protein